MSEANNPDNRQDYARPEKCPTCEGTGKENVGHGRRPIVWKLVTCHACFGSGEFRPYYKGKLQLAIIDALNVLGMPGGHKDPDKHCEGCQYEKDDAMDTLYSALGLHIDWKHAEECWEEFCKIRNAVWLDAEQSRNQESTATSKETQ